MLHSLGILYCQNCHLIGSQPSEFHANTYKHGNATESAPFILDYFNEILTNYSPDPEKINMPSWKHNQPQQLKHLTSFSNHSLAY